MILSSVHNQFADPLKHMSSYLRKMLRQTTDGALFLSETLSWLRLGGGPTRLVRQSDTTISEYEKYMTNI